ncbi:hypothetical protein HMPREF0620_1627 [Parascardovia denticolens DSM 10105 = JCM 12538]|uniref:Uncharacterized protein n=1 Tax=Parascardovia denticolens DSM 10105 = JCM 12538 TaxID=864564 RepID=E6K2F4_PARDN|nr:hypothetical protein HMPREF0620_1627 [Parascardovia denticolens DSM 10105 = JCM 12538]
MGGGRSNAYAEHVENTKHHAPALGKESEGGGGGGKKKRREKTGEDNYRKGKRKRRGANQAGCSSSPLPFRMFFMPSSSRRGWTSRKD